MSTLKENLTEILAEKQTYLKPGNLKKDVSLLGVTGTLEGVTGEEITITPTTSQQVITPTTGKNAITKATVSAVTSSIDANIIQSNIKAGVTILGVTGNVEPDKPDQTKTCTPTTSQQVIQPDTGYELASVTVNGVTSAIDSNITAGNIKSGTSILGVTGTYTDDATLSSNANLLTGNTAYAGGVKYTGSMANNGSKTFTPSASSQSSGAGYYSSITCSAVSNLSASNIKKGVTVGGTTGTYTSDATATASDIASGKTAYVNGSKVTGTSTATSINGIVEQYKATSGETISVGDFVKFIEESQFTSIGTETQISSSTNYGLGISAVILDSDRVLLTHRDSNGKIYAYVFTFNHSSDGTRSVTGGVDTLIDSTTNLSVATAVKIAKDKVFIITSSINACYGTVCTIDGKNISRGTKVTISTAQNCGNNPKIAKIEDNKVFIAYSSGSNENLKAVVCTVSGTIITVGTETSIGTNDYWGYTKDLVVMDKSKVLIFHNTTSSYASGVNVCTISGTTITVGTLRTLSSSNNYGNYIKAIKVGFNTILYLHTTGTTKSITADLLILKPLDDTFTASSTQSISTKTNSARFMDVLKLKNNKVFITYMYSSNIYGIVYDYSTKTVGTETQITTTNNYAQYTMVKPIADTIFIFLGLSASPYSLYSSYVRNTITVTPVKYQDDNIHGVATSSGTGDTLINIKTSGV